MSRRYNIKWRDSDEAELRRVVKNFNAKIDRLAKKDPKNASALPEKVRIGQLRGMIETRQDLNRELNSLRRFSQRGAEEFVPVPDSQYNMKYTQWQKQEMAIRGALVTRKRNKRLKELESIEMTSGGKPLGYTKKEFGMGKADELSLRPVTLYTRSMSRADLNAKHRSLVRQSQSTYFNKSDERYRNNYIQSLLENFNSDDIEDVIDYLQSMDIKDFIKKVKAEDPNFEFNYPPDEEEYLQYLNQLKTIWLPNRRKG